MGGYPVDEIDSSWVGTNVEPDILTVNGPGFYYLTIDRYHLKRSLW